MDIDAAIGLAGDRIDSASELGASAILRKGEIAGAELHRCDDLVGVGVLNASG